MVTKEIQKAIGTMQILKGHSVVCENISPLFRWEMDVMSISKSGMMYEFEVKKNITHLESQIKKAKLTQSKNVVGRNMYVDFNGIPIGENENHEQLIIPEELFKRIGKIVLIEYQKRLKDAKQDFESI